jgi:hypothetical protein
MRGLLLLYLELIGFPRAFNWRCWRNSATLLMYNGMLLGVLEGHWRIVYDTCSRCKRKVA